MRSSKSRSRSKSNRQRSLGNIVNRVFDSSGPEGKVRGTPQQIIEKYLTLARDAQLSHDRVAEQSFLQHAEHYTRMLGEAQREMAERQGGQQSGHGQPNQGQPNQNQFGQGHGYGQGGGQGNGGHGGQSRHDDGDGGQGAGQAAPAEQPQNGQREQPTRGQPDSKRDAEPEGALPNPVETDTGTPDGPVETPEAQEKPTRNRRARGGNATETAPRSAPARSRRKPAAAVSETSEAPTAEPAEKTDD